MSKSTMHLITVLCVLIATQGFLYGDISPNLVEVTFSLQITYDNAVIEVIDSQLDTGEQAQTITSANWSGTIEVHANYIGLDEVTIRTTIEGIEYVNLGALSWDGTGYAGSKTTTNGYTIEFAEQGYFNDTPPDEDPDVPLGTEVENLINIEILIAFGIGVILWQVFIKSFRHQSLSW